MVLVYFVNNFVNNNYRYFDNNCKALWAPVGKGALYIMQVIIIIIIGNLQSAFRDSKRLAL